MRRVGLSDRVKFNFFADNPVGFREQGETSFVSFIKFVGKDKSFLFYGFAVMPEMKWGFFYVFTKGAFRRIP